MWGKGTQSPIAFRSKIDSHACLALFFVNWQESLEQELSYWYCSYALNTHAYNYIFKLHSTALYDSSTTC